MTSTEDRAKILGSYEMSLKALLEKEGSLGNSSLTIISAERSKIKKKLRVSVSEYHTEEKQC